jgi:hypothetical protein
MDPRMRLRIPRVHYVIMSRKRMLKKKSVNSV